MVSQTIEAHFCSAIVGLNKFMLILQLAIIERYRIHIFKINIYYTFCFRYVIYSRFSHKYNRHYLFISLEMNKMLWN